MFDSLWLKMAQCLFRLNTHRKCSYVPVEINQQTSFLRAPYRDLRLPDCRIQRASQEPFFAEQATDLLTRILKNISNLGGLKKTLEIQ